jgi:hypothetical protein
MPRATATAEPTPSPYPLPSQSRPTGALTWSQPDPSPSDPTSLPGLGDDSPSASDEQLHEPVEPSTDAPTSSRGSSANPLSKAALRNGFRRGVLIIGDAANGLLARDEADQLAQVYVTDADDAEAIGDPLASIVQRRGGIGPAGNPDLVDALTALFGLVSYILKQLGRRKLAAEYRQRIAAGTMGAAAHQDAATGPGPGPAAEAAGVAHNVPLGS